MSKFKKGDFVVWHRPDRLPHPIYCTVDVVIDLPAADEPYYICFRERTANGKPFREHYEFWEHDLELVDMKGEMSMKEKQMKMMAELISNAVNVGVSDAVLELLINYSKAVIDMYKEEK